MNPEIFMDDFERSNSGDLLFSSIGRALTISTRFENNCKMLASIIGLKGKGFIERDKEFDDFIKKLFKNNLFQNIEKIFDKNDSSKNTLNKARSARNEIVHELTIGLANDIGNSDRIEIDEICIRIKELIAIISRGDLMTSFLLSKVTNEFIPSIKFMKNYENKIVEWVIEK